jgi:branched-chain amino acid transport system permease protein
MLVSVVLAIVCAYFVGSVALRLRRFTFGLATLASTVVFYWICNNWVSLTEGPYGIKGIPLPDLPIFMEALTRLQSFYILIFILSSLGTILIYQLVRSRVGRTLKAIREDEVLAESLGINVKKYKILSFIVAAILASVAGGFQTYYLGIVTPEVINFNVTTNLLVITIVGGLDNLGGVVLSNFVFTLLPEFLRVTEFFRNILFGLILVIASTYSIDKLLKILGIHARR